MKFGIMFANTGAAATDPERAAGLARIAEESGFESLWTVEHVVVPSGYQSAYPYSPDGRMPGGEDSPIPDPLVWLAYVAATTRRIRLATGIVILPQRNPAILAKEVATLDALSAGRVILGVGVGWLAEEFAALGVPFAERAARTDDYVGALRSLWGEGESTYAGRYAHFDRVLSYPKPVQAGGVPIVIGGHTPAAARRAGRLGDGFFPARGGLKGLPALLAEMRTAALEAGRDPDAIEVTTGGAMDVESSRAFGDLGVSRLVIPALGRDPDKMAAKLRQFGEDVIAPLS